MKFCLRRTATVVLAVALSLPTVAMAGPQKKDRGREKSEIVRIVQKIQRLLGISTNDDLPLPPPPKP